MQFDSLEAVKKFVGEDYEKSYVPDKARNVLSRHDERSQHYEIKEHITYLPKLIYHPASEKGWGRAKTTFYFDK